MHSVVFWVYPRYRRWGTRETSELECIANTVLGATPPFFTVLFPPTFAFRHARRV